ncbi:Hypothetical predicted protein, partial [Olea europaea subsp. europaea]
PARIVLGVVWSALSSRPHSGAAGSSSQRTRGPHIHYTKRRRGGSIASKLTKNQLDPLDIGNLSNGGVLPFFHWPRTPDRAATYSTPETLGVPSTSLAACYLGHT